jgi:sarcosine oxidase
MRVAVVGAGGVGSAAARFLAGAGHEVILLEQFAVDHDRGSSYGQSRVIRRVYPDLFYTRLMEPAYRLWRELETECGERLLLETGGLFFGPSDHPEMLAAEQSLRDAGVPFELWDQAEAAARVPVLRLDPNEVAISQRETGILRASRCVRANVRLARAQGAALRENAPVLGVSPTPDEVRLRLDGETLGVDRVLFTAGPWTSSLLADLGLPLQVTRQTYVHFRPDENEAAFRLGALPVWIDMSAYFYGFPEHDEAPGVKIALHQRGEPTDPDCVRRELDDADRAELREYARRRFVGLSGKILYEKVCLYTNTPDEDFIVDRHPADPRLVVVGGLSGHGFKFTVLLGKIAAALVTDSEVKWDISRFSMARFGPPD